MDLLLIGLIGWAIASVEVPVSPQEHSCIEYGGRLDAAPVAHSKAVQPPTILKLDYPELPGTTPAHYTWPLRLDVLVDAEGKVRRVCTRQPEGALAPFGDALSRSSFRPARLRGQPVAYETTLTIHLDELERRRGGRPRS